MTTSQAKPAIWVSSADMSTKTHITYIIIHILTRMTGVQLSVFKHIYLSGGSNLRPSVQQSGSLTTTPFGCQMYQGETMFATFFGSWLARSLEVWTRLYVQETQRELNSRATITYECSRHCECINLHTNLEPLSVFLLRICIVTHSQ